MTKAPISDDPPSAPDIAAISSSVNWMAKEGLISSEEEETEDRLPINSKQSPICSAVNWTPKSSRDCKIEKVESDTLLSKEISSFSDPAQLVTTSIRLMRLSATAFMEANLNCERR